MNTNSGQNHFQRGVLSLVVLTLLKQGDMYGYQLVQEIGQQSGGNIITKEGSLYPILYKFVDQGYISYYEVPVGKRMKRYYYHIEPSGIELLEELKKEYKSITEGVLRIIEESS